ncbi:TPA: hypothetical protein N0F65_009264 [Lagenidium giganteum]|uniref:Purple acid phosphatase N-terminal domain-containing protein n=1 Tax=Lagenidium giganteum TaxID=4803 RepID=A0AAV2YRM5_9STRA|nr:TPA: hypothetical protein N0F65_009264 [Lagenidium giganteum]
MAGTPDPRRSSGSMQPAAVLVVAAAFLAGAAAAPGGACPRTQPVLTSACGNLCYAGRPCIVYDDGTTCTQGQFGECHLGSAATSNCAVECLKNGKDDFVDKGFKDFTNYNFLLPFGAWKSEKEKNWDADDLVEAKTTITQNLTNQYPSKSNDILKAIDPLEFLQSTKNVAICGGTTSDGLKGRVSQVNLAPSLLYTQSQLDSVLLANLDIEQLKASSLPPQLVNLTLSNCLLNTFPDDLLLMTKLKRLNLAKNYFSSFPAKYSLKSVTFLNASKNNLVSFEAYFPSVVTLDLSGNTLDKIPDTIFNMTSLQELYLGQNSFSNLKVTPDQFQFLSKIPSLYIDNWNSAKCPSSAMKTLGDAAICVQEASTGSRASASSSNSSSNNKGLIGGIIGGVVGALVIAMVFIVYWRRSQSSKGKAYEVTRTGGSTKSGQATGAPSLRFICIRVGAAERHHRNTMRIHHLLLALALTSLSHPLNRVRAAKPHLDYPHQSDQELEDSLARLSGHVWTDNEQVLRRSFPRWQVSNDDEFDDQVGDDATQSKATLKAYPTSLEDGEDLVVSWSNVASPHEKDYLALSCGKTLHADDFFMKRDVTHTDATPNSVRFSSLIMMRCNYTVSYYNYNPKYKDYKAIGKVTVGMKDSFNAPKHGHIALTSKLDEMAVMFNSASNKTPSVQYGRDPDKLDKELTGTFTTYTASDMCHSPANITGQAWFRDPGYMHKVVLTGLDHDQRYFYRFGNKEDGWSSVYSFRSRPDSSVKATKFIAYADMGADVAPSATSTAMRSFQDVTSNGFDHFLLHFGDVSYARGHAHMWDEFFHLIEPYATRVPYMVSIGNHEYDYTSGGHDHDPSGATGDDGRMDFHPDWANYGSDSSGECSVPIVSHINDWGYLRVTSTEESMALQFILNRDGTVYDEVELKPWL